MGMAQLVLGICLTTSVLVSLRVRHQVLARDQVRFDQSAQSAHDALVREIETYVSALRGVRGLFEARGNVDPGEWGEYVRSLDLKANYPGIMDLGFAGRV